jgi:hypothetical protein
MVAILSYLEDRTVLSRMRCESCRKRSKKRARRTPRHFHFLTTSGSASLMRASDPAERRCALGRDKTVSACRGLR